MWEAWFGPKTASTGGHRARSGHAWAHRGDRELWCGYPWASGVSVLWSLWDLLSSAPYIKGAADHDRIPLWCHRGPKTPNANLQRSHLPGCCTRSTAATPPCEESRATQRTASRRLSCTSTQRSQRYSQMSLGHPDPPVQLPSLSHQSHLVTSMQTSLPCSNHPFVPH